jgi:PhnB protein
MKLSTHLTFNGQCEAAFAFYERCLGGKIDTMIAYGDSPMAELVPAEWCGKIVHASLTLGDDCLNGADVLPAEFQRPQGFFVLLRVRNAVDAERIFHALAENGAVQMPIQKTFWSPCFGVVVDRFGIPWEISCEQASGAG